MGRIQDRAFAMSSWTDELMVVCQVQTDSDGGLNGVVPVGFSGRITDMTGQPDVNRPTQPNLTTYRYQCGAVSAALVDADPSCYVESWVKI